MDPITSIAVGVGAYYSQKAISLIEDKFGELIIRRWSRHRANEFIAKLVEEVTKQHDANRARIDRLLDTILQDEAKSEVLFDAYRRVSLAASKTLGPRIIGHLTAKIISENRNANATEEKIAIAAESLSDSELAEFLSGFRKMASDAEEGHHGSLLYKECEEMYESDSSAEVLISSSDLDCWGTWATKLRNIGMVSQFSKQKLDRRYPNSRDVYIISQWLTFDSACGALADHIERCSPDLHVNLPS